MTWPPCGTARCPVIEPTSGSLRNLRTVMLPAGSIWWRGSRYPADNLVPPGIGNTKFAPLATTRHCYFGASKTVALLESALHSAAGPSPTINAALLDGWAVSEIELVHDLCLADLRDERLEQMGLVRQHLVDTTARHYVCTRAWAEKIQSRTARRAGGDAIAGILWNSRQADLHARSRPDGLLADVLHHAPAEVAVAWHPHGPARPFRMTGQTVPLVENGEPARLLQELSCLIGAPIEH